MGTVDGTNARPSNLTNPAKPDRIRTTSTTDTSSVADTDVTSEPEATTEEKPRTTTRRGNSQSRVADRRRQTNAQTQQLRARLESSVKPTTLMNEELDDGEENCLEHAAEKARAGQDDIVFLEDRRGAETNTNDAGHTLVRDRENGSVTDPTSGERFDTTDDWIAAQGTAPDGGPAYVETAAVAAEKVQDVLSVPPEERAERIAAHGDPALSKVADQVVADDPIDPVRRRAIDAYTREHQKSSHPGSETTKALEGDSSLGALSNAEASYLIDSTIDRWRVNDDFLRLEMGSNRIANFGRDNPSMSGVVADTFAKKAVTAARRPDDRVSQLNGVTFADAAIRASRNPEGRRALIDRMGDDAPGLVAALRPNDDTIFGPYTSPPSERAASIGHLLDGAAQGEATPTTAAITQAAFEQLPAEAYDRNRALPGQMGRALGKHWNPNDPAQAQRDGARFSEILGTSQGAELLASTKVPAAARADALALLRANPDISAATLKAHGGSGWTNPEVMKGLATPRARDFLELRGDDPQKLSGTNLDNTVGFAMGLPPNVPGNETETQRDAREARVAEGRHSYYANEDNAKLVEPVTSAIRQIGGTDPNVTVLPVQYSSEETGPVQLPLFRVQDKNTGADRFVDNTGRTYESFDDWKDNNKLPSGNMVYPTNGHITAGGDGQPRLGSANTPDTVDTFGEHALRVLDGAALVGGVVAGGAVIIGSGGTAAPLVLGGASLYAAGRTAGRLYDRGTHGQSLNPITDATARSEWLNLGANALGFGAAGATMGAVRMAKAGHALSPLAATTAGALNVGASVADTAGIADAGHTLLTKWDDLSVGDRAQLGMSMAFWGTSMAARPRMAKTAPINTFDANAMRNGIIQSGRRANPLRPNPNNFTPGAQVSQNFRPTMDHMFAPGTIGVRSKGVNGGHRPAEFHAALRGEGQVVGTREVPGFPGMSVVDYRMNKMNPDGTPAGGVTNKPQQKTLLDPEVWTPAETQRLMQDVFGDVRGNGTVTRNVNGVEFIGWVRDGQLQSFGVNLPPQ